MPAPAASRRLPRSAMPRRTAAAHGVVTGLRLSARTFAQRPSHAPVTVFRNRCQPVRLKPMKFTEAFLVSISGMLFRKLQSGLSKTPANDFAWIVRRRPAIVARRHQRDRRASDRRRVRRAGEGQLSWHTDRQEMIYLHCQAQRALKFRRRRSERLIRVAILPCLALARPPCNVERSTLHVVDELARVGARAHRLSAGLVGQQFAATAAIAVASPEKKTTPRPSASDSRASGCRRRNWARLPARSCGRSTDSACLVGWGVTSTARVEMIPAASPDRRTDQDDIVLDAGFSDTRLQALTIISPWSRTVDVSQSTTSWHVAALEDQQHSIDNN